MNNRTASGTPRGLNGTSNPRRNNDDAIKLRWSVSHSASGEPRLTSRWLAVSHD
jgi:hypothetical protein